MKILKDIHLVLSTDMVLNKKFGMTLDEIQRNADRIVVERIFVESAWKKAGIDTSSRRYLSHCRALEFFERRDHEFPQNREEAINHLTSLEIVLRDAGAPRSKVILAKTINRVMEPAYELPVKIKKQSSNFSTNILYP